MADFLTKEAYSFSVSDASVSFQVPSAEDQQLFIVLTAEFPSSSYGSFFTVSAWKTESTREWSPDTHQDVYQPEKTKTFGKTKLSKIHTISAKRKDVLLCKKN